MKQPFINVGILSAPFIEFDLFGGYRYAGYDQPVKGNCTAELTEGKIKLTRNGNTETFEREITITPASFDTGSFQLRDVVIGKSFHWERKENQRFSGTLKIMIEKDVLTAINILPLEDYLTSVISSEMSPNSSLEFLKTHAIVSRSWLISQIKQKVAGVLEGETSEKSDDEIIKWYDREDHDNFDVCADDHCQRYQGITKVISKTAQKAIDQTTGLVLKHNNMICDTRYSKCCGGLTENFENVWGDEKHAYLTMVPDYKFEPDCYDIDFSLEGNAEKWIRSNPPAYCNTKDEKILAQVLVDFDQETKDFYRWKVKYSQEEISSLIKEKTGIDFGNIVDLVPLERGESTRIIKLKIVGTKKTLTIGKELEIRRALSKSHLYSSAFFVRKSNIENNIPAEFEIIGAGWGHGVGLCQIGAAVMSEMGYEFDEILFHYFKGSKIAKLY